MNILITGSEGFIGKNLIAILNQNKNNKILEFNKSTKQKLENLVKKSDLIYHLAGENIGQAMRQYMEKAKKNVKKQSKNILKIKKISF